MAFENSQAVTIDSKKVLLTDQFESVCKMEVPNDKPIKRILGINAVAKITAQEKVADGVNFSGNTYYHVSYQTEEGGLAAVSVVTSWQEKLEQIDNQNFVICPDVKENVITSQSFTEIEISSLINVTVLGVGSEKIYSVDGMGGDYVKLENTHEYQKAVNFVSDTFNEVSEQQVGAKIEEVIGYFANVQLKNAMAGIDTVTYEGEVFINTTLLIDGQIQTQVKTVEFRHESAVLGTVPNNLADVDVDLNGLNVTASVSEIDGTSNLIYALDLTANIAVYSKDNMTVVEDLFSVSKITSCQYECVKSTVFDGDNYFSENQVLTFLADQDVDDINFVNNATVSISDVVNNDGKYILNGAVCVDAVFGLENQERFAQTGFAPFSVELPDYKKDDDLKICAKVLSYKLKNSKEVALTVEFDIRQKKYTCNYISYVSSVQEEDDKVLNDAGIRVYITGENENLFNIAKTINVRPDDIVAQNPGVENNFEKGTRLVIYTPLNIDF